MKEKEICFRFKRNGCKPGHIKILAELNAVDQDVIEKILSKQGLISLNGNKEDIHG